MLWCWIHIRCGTRTNRGGTLHPSSIGSTKTHQHIHQWNTVRSVPNPNVFDTAPEEACTKRRVASPHPILLPIDSRSFSIPGVNEYLVSFSKRILLECRCGERLLLLGLDKDWRAERRTTFKCGGCGAKLSLDGVSSRGLRRQALRAAASSIIHRVP